MQTIDSMWEAFAETAIPKAAHPTQRQEMRRSFYAGVHAALMLGVEMAEESGDDDDLGAAMMQGVEDECLRFMMDVAAGRA